MSSDPYPRPDAPGNDMRLPQAVIDQAEAVATNENEDADSSHPGRDNSKLEASKSEASRPTTPNAADAARTFITQEPPIEHVPPVAYGSQLGQVDFSQDDIDTKAKVAKDGRINIDINQKSQRLSDLLVPALRSQLNLQHDYEPAGPPPGNVPPTISGLSSKTPPPSLNVVIQVVGSRGDVQPFIALGRVLKERYGHRVRLATHRTFRGFVEENGLEYFNIGGDPAELMAFMVKNPGLMPGMDSLKSGDVGKRRKGMYEIFQGCWRSCIEVGDGTGIRASDDQPESRSSLDSGIAMDGDSSAKPFVADAIIANPPSFAGIHCAEKLGIPLHLMFTMPWSPTQAFPHPLANIQSSNANSSITNFVSYALVEMMTWQGLGDIINRFREKSLGLEPISLMWAPGMASRLRIPYTYCWSPALIPKPKDWGPHICVSGFYFLSLANSFTPERDLTAFLEAGPPPVYIGFGSIVVDDPDAMTKLIFEAVKQSGQRALVSKGWGGFGADVLEIPDGVFMLGNVPHDWLFSHVSCVVHHGGAGTTAAGIALGKPTVIVPFFGDQPFWGAMVARAGAGPSPVPSKHLTAEKLAAAITEALNPATLGRAQELGARIGSEKGTDVGAQNFHDQLNIDSMRCSVSPSRVAVWRVKRTNIRLSAFAATALGNEGLLSFNDLKLYRPREYDSEDGPWDPISGGASALLGTFGSLVMGFADFPVEILRALRIKPSEDIMQGDAASTPVESQLRPTNSAKGSIESPQAGESESGNVVNIDVAPLEIQESDGNQSSLRERHSQSPDKSTPKPNHPSSMRSVFQKSMSQSSSRSSSPNRRGAHPQRTHSGNQASQMSLEAALGAGKSIKQIVGAGLKSPMDFTLGLARGFHNAPKLYGDESVRQADKVTDLQSGLKAAGKEFGFGFYDGISGLVTQPLEGAKREGVAGLIKGFGKGIGGAVLKPGAAIWGLPGYTFKGIYQELQKHLGSSVQNYIVAARTAQGYEDWHRSTKEELLDTVARWQAVQVQLEKEKHRAHHGSFHGHCYLKRRHMSFDEKKKLSKEKKKGRRETQDKQNIQVDERIAASHPFVNQSQRSGESRPSTGDAQFEAAIQASVAATSHGILEEDAIIEKAIRASVAELHLTSEDDDDSDAVRTVIQASVNEAAQARHQETSNSYANAFDGAADRDKGIETALYRSVQEHQAPSNEHHPLANVDFDDSGVDTDDDANIKLAIERSSSSSIDASNRESSTDDLQKAVELSMQAHEEREQSLEKAKTEEEVLLEYVKQQSLVEDQRRQVLNGQITQDNKITKMRLDQP